MKPIDNASPRSRTLYAGLLLVTIAAGLASRRFPDLQPEWMSRYAGDTLWAAMMFWLLALVAVRARTVVLGATALGTAWTVEASQLIHRPWLDALRASRAGALVLGQGFLWSDLLCYAVGVGIAVVVDVAWRQRGSVAS
jgi:hypothetical protein